MSGSDSPLIEARNVSRVFRIKSGGMGKVAELLAVNGVSFRIGRGESIGLVGESGCGKSTLGRLVSGLITPSSGEILFEGSPLPPAGASSPIAGRIQMVFQDPYSSLNPRLRVGSSVAEGLRAPCFRKRGKTDVDVDDVVRDIFETVGIGGMERRFPHEFSGGQRQRVALARALVTDPDLIVCDEPVSALDASVQAQVLNTMRDVQERYSLSLLFITHNLAVVGFMCERILVMYLGEIVEDIPRGELSRGGAHPYTQALFVAMPERSSIGKPIVPLEGEIPSPLHLPDGCAFHPRCSFAEERCRLEKPAWKKLAEGWRVRCHRA